MPDQEPLACDPACHPPDGRPSSTTSCGELKVTIAVQLPAQFKLILSHLALRRSAAGVRPCSREQNAWTLAKAP